MSDYERDPQSLAQKFADDAVAGRQVLSGFLKKHAYLLNDLLAFETMAFSKDGVESYLESCEFPTQHASSAPDGTKPASFARTKFGLEKLCESCARLAMQDRQVKVFQKTAVAALFEKAVALHARYPEPKEFLSHREGKLLYGMVLMLNQPLIEAEIRHALDKNPSLYEGDVRDKAFDAFHQAFFAYNPEKSSFSNYFNSILKKRLPTRMRKDQHMRQEPTDIGEPVDQASHTPLQHLCNEENKNVLDTMETLPDKQWHALALRVRGLSDTSAGISLGLSAADTMLMREMATHNMKQQATKPPLPSQEKTLLHLKQFKRRIASFFRDGDDRQVDLGDISSQTGITLSDLNILMDENNKAGPGNILTQGIQKALSTYLNERLHKSPEEVEIFNMCFSELRIVMRHTKGLSFPPSTSQGVPFF